MTKRSILALGLAGVLFSACGDDEPAKRGLMRSVRNLDAGARPSPSIPATAPLIDASPASDTRAPEAGAPAGDRDGGAGGEVGPGLDAGVSDGSVPDPVPTDATAPSTPDTSPPVTPADATIPQILVDAGGEDAPPEVDAPPAAEPEVDAGGEDAATPTADAGPVGGDATCQGTTRRMACQAYCGLVSTACSGGNAQYPTIDACQDTCEDADWVCGVAGALSGNSLSCRVSQAGVAFFIPATAAVSCANAGPDSPACR